MTPSASNFAILPADQVRRVSRISRALFLAALEQRGFTLTPGTADRWWKYAELSLTELR